MSSSLRDATYDELRRRIINLAYQPGERLIERDLAAEFDVSRIPLREAMQLLQNDGLVVLVPRQGAIVAPFTADDVRDLFDVRESLEVLAVRLAATRTTDDGLARLQDQMALARDAILRRDDPEIAAANAGFHRVLVEMAANPLLSTLMGPLAGRVQWLFHLTHRRDLVLQCEEHEEIYTAVVAGDPDLAARHMFDHVSSGREESIALAADWSVIDPVAATRSRRR